MLASMPAIISVQSACKLFLHNVTICATIFSRTVHFAKLQKWSCNCQTVVVLRKLHVTGRLSLHVFAKIALNTWVCNFEQWSMV